MLVLTKGPMGVGKSATVRALGKPLAWPVIDKDDAADVLLEHLEVYGPLTYDLMFAQAASLLKQGFSFIVDSPLRSELGLKNAEALAREYDVNLYVLDCQCSDQAEWRGRLENRTRRPAYILKTWQDFETYWETAERDFAYPIPHPVLELDTLEALENNVAKTVEWLAKEE